MIHTSLLSYSAARERMKTNPLLRSNVPVEHTVSLPLPTLRWNMPVYACFAGPARRRPGQPLQQGAPDRWWAISAQNGQLVIYALWSVQPYVTDVAWQTVILPEEKRSIQEIQQSLTNIQLLMDALVPAFFAGETGDAHSRNALAEALKVHLPAPLQPWYRALAPDFFAWLEG